MKKHRISTLALALALMAGLAPAPASYAHWADEYYEGLREGGVLNEDFGKRPEEAKDEQATREEFFALIMSALRGRQAAADGLARFGDFAEVAPALTGYLAAAYEEGVSKGYLIDGEYYMQPGNPVTREEAATILGRVCGLAAGGNSDSGAGPEPGFTDAAAIQSYAAGYVAAAHEAGLMEGYPDGSFQPREGITWAETAALIERARQGGFLTYSGTVVLLGNNSRGAHDSESRLASFNAPHAVLVESGVIYVADTDNNLIRRADGDGTLYIADTGNGAVRKLSGGNVSTVAGQDGQTAGGLKYFTAPRGLCLYGGELYVTDAFMNTVVRVKLYD